MQEKKEMLLCEDEELHPEAMRRARERMPSAARALSLAELFRIFGDPTRLGILMALEAGELCVCDIAALTGVTKSAVSHQLRLLRESNLVACRRVGKNVLCSLADGHVGTILDTAAAHLDE